jgi:hypothetical protein
MARDHRLPRREAETVARIHLAMGWAPCPPIAVRQHPDGEWPRVELPCRVTWLPWTEQTEAGRSTDREAPRPGRREATANAKREASSMQAKCNPSQMDLAAITTTED